ncbi:TetR family transcriptional regulator [Virgisporangium aliadipatigenens]|uniref:TetR family transcriptional regulator n=1 Tax=Virgisporangium aliadipatigenens TaxID=741659 RepID=A0A8J4DRH3_9ACTN|nr:TetR/AcrR family transcriptional regulator [Virgisporangium aliadipatigenens]GIJ47066.1 TetR family transcriptional regulator [Virgisporangium aliadipatigenens]
MSDQQPTVRERSRRAVQREIAEVALGLFVEHGYDATTTEGIAAAAGMSQRTVYRYFATKDEILIGKVDLVVADMLDALRARPADEPVWTSLRRTFDVFGVPYHPEYAAAIVRLVFDTPTLLAAYLEKLQRAQDSVVAVLQERAVAARRPYAADDPTPRALTAAAFGCLIAAHHSWLASGPEGPFDDAVDRAMATIQPQT